MGILSTLGRWFGRNALGEVPGAQAIAPGMALVPDGVDVGVDGALQLSTVWACVDRRASLLASLPFFAYTVDSDGQKTLARGTRLYSLLKDSPNARMTPFEFWRSMVLNHDLRGNAYARIDRAPDGEAVALWPMPADQVQPVVLDDGAVVYEYRIGQDVAMLASDNVLHLKNLGNGTMGMSKLEFMRASTGEAARSQASASKMFGSGGKPTGVLMVDAVMNPEQRAAVKRNFAEMAEGSTSRLYLLEGQAKYQPISMTAEDQQLLESRKFSVEELCRWFDVPPVLVHHSNVTAWGTGIFEIKDGFYTLALTPLCENIEQAFRKRVLTPRQRATTVVEFSIDALLRASISDRYEIYSKAVQNGLKTRNEVRQLENDPKVDGGDELTVQTNLVPLHLLGAQPKLGATNAPAQNTPAV